jgi:hypothetical protein
VQVLRNVTADAAGMRSPDSLLIPADPAVTLEVNEDHLPDIAAAVHATVTGAIAGVGGPGRSTAG